VRLVQRVSKPLRRACEQTVLGHGIDLAAAALVLFFDPGLVRVFLPFPAELDWWNRILALPV